MWVLIANTVLAANHSNYSFPWGTQRCFAQSLSPDLLGEKIWIREAYRYPSNSD